MGLFVGLKHFENTEFYKKENGVNWREAFAPLRMPYFLIIVIGKNNGGCNVVICINILYIKGSKVSAEVSLNSLFRIVHYFTN